MWLALSFKLIDMLSRNIPTYFGVVLLLNAGDCWSQISNYSCVLNMPVFSHHIVLILIAVSCGYLDYLSAFYRTHRANVLNCLFPFHRNTTKHILFYVGLKWILNLTLTMLAILFTTLLPNFYPKNAGLRLIFYILHAEWKTVWSRSTLY